jgi:hypothetical protein
MSTHKHAPQKPDNCWQALQSNEKVITTITTTQPTNNQLQTYLTSDCPFESYGTRNQII